MPEILKAFKYRLYPDKDQTVMLNKTFGCVRFFWNQLVDNFNSWTPDYMPPVMTEQTIKHQDEYKFLQEVSNCALQQKQRDFNETKHQYFNKSRKVRIGRPHHKKTRGRQSFRLTKEKFTLNQDLNIIRLEKIGKVRIKIHQEIPDGVDYRSVTVSKDPSGKMYASILVKINVDPKPLTGRMVGIDLGLKDLFILSDGQVISNPKFFRENQTELKKAQQHLARKTKGSNRYRKQNLKVAKIHEKIRFKRNNLLNEVSTALVNNYDVICIEDLNVAGMIKNHCLSKSIADASWSSFTTMLDYKCSWYGKTLVKIDRWYPSSKTCHCCGHKLDSLELDTREWTCQECSSAHDRDWNAAINILRKGYSDLTGTPLEFGTFPKVSSVESIEYSRGEEISPLMFSNNHHLASSLKRLEFV